MINNEPRYASLSSGLLARKGSAKPAMRPQGFTGFEDLGWNDMGHDVPQHGQDKELPEHVPSSIAALTPAPKPGHEAEADFDEHDYSGEEPEVVAQQRAIAETFASEPEAEVEAEAEAEAEIEIETASPVVAAPAPAKAPAQVVALPPRPVAAPSVDGRKSAFTLRLDADRHLRLRLATAVTGRSAQQIVTGALDALLANIPEVEALAERVPPAKAKRN